MFSYPAPQVVGGGVVEQAFSYANPVLTVGTAAYPVTTMTFLSSSAIIKMGAAPASIGAINVDASSYSTVAMSVVNGTVSARLIGSASSFQVGTVSAHTVILYANNLDQWIVSGATAATSTLQSSQVTARIVGGSTNGLAIRNSGNTRDNWLINDAGTSAVLFDSTRSIGLRTIAATGEVTAGGGLYAPGSNDVNISAGDLSSAAGRVARISYYNQTTNLSALEVANVASGSGTLALMKSGGNVVIGGTAAGATASGTLAFGTTAGTSPSATVDLVHLYGLDISAGNRSLAIYQECPTNAAAAVASTHRLPVTINGTQYAILLTTVLS